MHYAIVDPSMYVTPPLLTLIDDQVGEIVYLNDVYFPWDGIPIAHVDGQGPEIELERPIINVENPNLSDDTDLILVRMMHDPGYMFCMTNKSLGPTLGSDAFETMFFPRDEIRTDVTSRAYALEIPRETVNQIEVSGCENHCRTLDGIVRVSKLSESEGIVTIRLDPIDIESNSRLSGAYKCTLDIVEYGPFWGRFKCVFSI